MATYHLWSPWTPLDEYLQWLRQATPKKFSKHHFRCIWSSHYLIDWENETCSQEIWGYQGSKTAKPKLQLCNMIYLDIVRSNKNILRPQPILLIGLDFVFGRIIHIQPPKWTGSFRVSALSAFSRVINPNSAEHHKRNKK
ncbi:hypothetical protein GDO86_007472 [Hymenochirus boettgeri]|uniref:Uncharacterized protein n=1 Tax=Hymenochirus boettgeri TaxID=247094 RepID=A0A8T2IWP2_9PIPI|nr:hypothetical protein GDO86_007472 [Hymenochirus boettgeri]